VAVRPNRLPQQPLLPFLTGRTDTARPPGHLAIVVAGRTMPVVIARHRRARRYVLRMAPDEQLRLTVPRGASISAGLRFAERQRDWILRESARLRDRARAWDSGTVVWHRGERVAIARDERDVRCGTETVRLSAPDADVRVAIEAWWRAAAERELIVRTQELASATGSRVARVSVRNQRSRWGACSARGVITLNWRLIQMPPSVSDYVIFHELMHLRQPNHSRRFWREVASVCAGWRDAERWLRKHGREIL